VQLSRESLLKVYEREVEVEFGRGERLFRTVALCSFLVFGFFGVYLRTHNLPERYMEERAAARARQVSFIIEEKKKNRMAVEQPKPAALEQKPKPTPVEKKETSSISKEPIDLTQQPQLDQKVEDAKPDNSQAKSAEPVRRVYGLRKVYATGIGEGGSAAGAVIGKRGNTLAIDIDTIAATEKDLKGTLVPITTVQSVPRVRVQVKPEYTKEMIDNGVQGVIKAKLLIDVDGKVKEVVILNDLGFGTKERAREALLKWVFEPARRGIEPVAVWIAFSIRFVLLDE
jgi:hypothetical protein